MGIFLKQENRCLAQWLQCIIDEWLKLGLSSAQPLTSSEIEAVYLRSEVHIAEGWMDTSQKLGW